MGSHPGVAPKQDGQPRPRFLRCHSWLRFPPCSYLSPELGACAIQTPWLADIAEALHMVQTEADCLHDCSFQRLVSHAPPCLCQRTVSERVHRKNVRIVTDLLPPPEHNARFRSCAGAYAGLWLAAVPTTGCLSSLPTHFRRALQL